ncbi:hypothetical protein B0J11DRAFT_586096 [Dendryphion nanum]|uniref:Rhodopsin domain-containing protein n=1 Tax=Dendryphion nanum TaxID=256645 RepID=A0A9P9I7M5_9PLEO|nr:hypothetical protein B0J11DRAFT_586096 [Dendryphion nanum]
MYDYRSTLNTVGWVLAAFSTLFIAARFYTRIRISTMLGWDDWCMLFGWMFAIICTSLVSAGTTHGFGQHIWEIKDPEDQANAAMYVLLAPCFSIASAFMTKTSIVIAFMRVMGRTVTWVHKVVAYVPLVLLFIGSAVSCSVMIFFCWPVQKSWRPYLQGKCLDPVMLDVVGKTVSAYNAAMDVFCAAVPYFLIRNLNIPRKDKRNLIILMGGSIFGTFATVMKIVAMSSISNVADITHAWSEITIWYLAENHVLIIAGSFPALRPFWRTLYGKYTSYRSSSNPSSDPIKSKNAQGGQNDSYTLHTVGSTPRNKKRPGLYSTQGGKDSSEESLNPATKTEGEGMVEEGSVLEAILVNHGDGRIENLAKVRGGCGRKGAEGRDTEIRVTREVQVV